MADIILEQNEANDKYLAAKEQHKLFMCLLLIGGVLLVCLAIPLGQVLVPKEYAGTSVGWSPDDVRDIALVLRILGVMAFAAGLVERLIIGIRYDRETVAV